MLSNPLSGGKFSWELFPGKDGWGTQSDSMGHKTTAWDTKGHKAIAGGHKVTACDKKGQLGTQKDKKLLQGNTKRLPGDTKDSLGTHWGS